MQNPKSENGPSHSQKGHDQAWPFGRLKRPLIDDLAGPNLIFEKEENKRP